MADQAAMRAYERNPRNFEASRGEAMARKQRDPLIKLQRTKDEDVLRMTYKKRSYAIFRAGENLKRPARGHVSLLGESGNRRKPIAYWEIDIPISALLHAIFDGTIPKTYSAIVLRPEDWQKLIDLGASSSRRNIKVVK